MAHSVHFRTVNPGDYVYEICKNVNTPCEQYYLQGFIYENNLNPLLSVLRTMCENFQDDPRSFDDHETCFSIYVPGRPERPLITLRVLQALNQERVPYILRYLGQPQNNEFKATCVRTFMDIAVSHNVADFITMMGFTMDYDFISRGYSFRRDRIQVTVTKIHNLRYSKAICEPALKSFTDRYLVEVSLMVPVGEETIGEEVRQFAERLKPLVVMDKVDYWRN